MCTPIDHLSKYKSNKIFIEHLEDTTFKDWQVTGCFYAGLHKLNEYLHCNFSASDSDINGHKEIRDYLESNKLMQLQEDFISAQRLSHVARYKFINMNERVILAKKYLKKIEDNCTIK